jgi:hypothetical protein
MEWSLHDLSNECDVPWIVEPGGRDAEYDPGSLSFTPPASTVTTLASSTDCVLYDYSFYQPSIRPVVPAAPIMLDQLGTSPHSAQYQSVEVNDGERSKVDQGANHDVLRSQQLLFAPALEQLCSPERKGEEICPPGCTEKIK